MRFTVCYHASCRDLPVDHRLATDGLRPPNVGIVQQGYKTRTTHQVAGQREDDKASCLSHPELGREKDR